MTASWGQVGRSKLPSVLEVSVGHMVGDKVTKTVRGG